MISGTEAMYLFRANKGNDDTNKVRSVALTEGRFTIPEGASRQVLIEVYFDPQFYDLELLLESKEAAEVRTHNYASRTDTDVAQFKGSKRVFVEAEPGEYKLRIIAKLPALSPETKDYAPQFIQCQLYALSAASIPSRVLRPASLNYYGLLGPTGKNYGQFIYHLPEVLLEAREYIDLEFNLTGATLKEMGGPSIDVQAIEADGRGDQLDISLREITQENLPTNGS